MAAIVWADVTAMPGVPATFATVDVGFQTVLLAIANGALDVNRLDGETGNMTKLGRMLYVAHMLTTILQGGLLAGGVSGPVKRDTADKLTVEYGSFHDALASSSDPFASTPYGRSLLLLVWAKTRAVVL
jgi:hypothetical protein